jgi:hypothetical protein
MCIEMFRRHARARVDSATHAAFASLPHHSPERSLFERLLVVARPRQVAQADALRNLADFADAVIRAPEDFAGAYGHPLQVVDALGSHLFGHATPRFLASAWFGDRGDDALARRRWLVAHARGARFRGLDLPLAMTRRMEDIFLHTPDHIRIDPALRRAEVLGLGGTEALASAVLATRLAERFYEPARWRVALAWLVRCGDTVDLAQVGPLVDFLHTNLHTVELKGRTFASAMRLVAAWHDELSRARVARLVWRPSRWRELVVPIPPRRPEDRCAEWAIVELLDSRELALEGRRMRHCVAIYARNCAGGRLSIWSLRRRWCDDGATESLVTFSVWVGTGRIVEMRAHANARPTPWQVALVRSWAVREGVTLQQPTGLR